jgi:prepilin-type N-terminal cleavage/methylation domain-containing protein
MPLRPKRAFTLVEMLVVIGIISILAALLLPAITSAVGRARNTAIALEVKEIDTALEAYRLEKGDYPPNFRSSTDVTRHIAKCYPRINPAYAQDFVNLACAFGKSSFIDEGESLVFWLSMTDTNPQYPFLSYYNPNPASAGVSGLTPSPKRYYDFDQTRAPYEPINNKTAASGMLSGTSAVFYGIPSFQAKYCQDTYYVYIDARSYMTFAPGSSYTPYVNGTAVDVEPYWSTAVNTSNPAAANYVQKYKAMNATTFQIICAGQDGDYGTGAATTANAPKIFPSGDNYIKPGDYDNITNFSGGRTLGDNIK